MVCYSECLRLALTVPRELWINLAEAGVVGGEEGTKPREILMTMEEFEKYLSS